MAGNLSCSDLDDSLLITMARYLDYRTLTAWLSLNKRWRSLKTNSTISQLFLMLKPPTTPFKQWYRALIIQLNRNSRPYNFIRYVFGDINEFYEASMLKYLAFQCRGWILSSLRLGEPQTSLEYEMGIALLARKYGISPEFSRHYLNRARQIRAVVFNLSLVSLTGLSLYYAIW